MPPDDADQPDAPKLHPQIRMRDVRRLAVQALYLIDATGNADADTPPTPDDLHEALDEPFDDGDTPVPVEPKQPAIELALSAWARHEEADAQINRFAEDWPTHRQPPVDRAILRLAWFEMATRRNDNGVIINEAVELAKQFSNEHAPKFINGVLDRLAKRYPDGKEDGAVEGDTATPAPITGDGWLDDALKP